MTCFYVFNGDADGLCALQQLHLADPGDAILVTGVKRDIGLLARVEAPAGLRSRFEAYQNSISRSRRAPSGGGSSGGGR